MVQTDTVERVKQSELTLDLMGLDHALEDIADSKGLTLARKMVGNGKDCTQVVGGVTPLSCKPAVIEVEPPDLGADVERSADGVDLEVRSGNLRA